MRALLCLSALALAFGGCAAPMGSSYRAQSTALRLSPLTIYQDSTGTLSYEAPTPADVGRKLSDRQVSGDACQWGLQLPLGLLVAAANENGNQLAGLGLSIAAGEGGYRAAVLQAQTSAGPGAKLYDLRADLHTRMVLGIWIRQCTHVTARVVDQGPSRGEPLPR